LFLTMFLKTFTTSQLQPSWPGTLLHHCHFTSAPPMLIQSSSASSIALFLNLEGVSYHSYAMAPLEEEGVWTAAGSTGCAATSGPGASRCPAAAGRPPTAARKRMRGTWGRTDTRPCSMPVLACSTAEEEAATTVGAAPTADLRAAQALFRDIMGTLQGKLGWWLKITLSS